MTENAESIGANAIINVRFSTSSISSGAAESYVYGTAVKVWYVLSTNISDTYSYLVHFIYFC